MISRSVPVLFLFALGTTLFLSPSTEACCASYMKQLADQASRTSLYHKAARVSDKYMQHKGISPTSPAGLITRPYVIGTTLYDNQRGTMSGNIRNYPQVENGVWQGHLLDKAVDECVQDCLDCSHHQGHFKDGLYKATGSTIPTTTNLGG